MINARALLLTVLAVLPSASALAAPFTYAPPSCEFKIAFPEKPFIEQKCTGADKKECTEVVNFTKAFGTDTSVNFRITCNAYDPSELSKYTTDVMKETLTKMITDASLQANNIEAQERDGFKSVAAVNIGTRGDRDIFYTGQIWIGKTSLFTLEGDITGVQSPESDELFSQVLKSMAPKNLPEKKEPSKKP